MYHEFEMTDRLVPELSQFGTCYKYAKYWYPATRVHIFIVYSGILAHRIKLSTDCLLTSVYFMLYWYYLRRKEANMLTVTYMTGGVHVHGGDIDIRLRSFAAVMYIVSTSGLEVKVEYSNQNIGAVAD